MNWNTDIRTAPHGRYVVKQRREGVDQRVFVPERVILTTKCGKVTLSHYIPEKKRWMMLGDGEQPVAWMPWPEPYPHLPSGAAACAADSPARSNSPPSISSGTNSSSDQQERCTDFAPVESSPLAARGSDESAAPIVMKHEGIRA